MLVSDLSDLQLHPHLHIATLSSWHTQHPKAWFIRNSLIDPSIFHQGIPRLSLMLLRRLRVHIRNLTACAALRNVQNEFLCRRLGPCFWYNAQRLPPIFVPGLVTFDDDIWPEAMHVDGDVFVVCADAGV